MLKEALLVFFGSGLGGLVRFAISKNLNSENFPWATLCSNIFACFVLGLTISLAENKGMISPATKLFITVGFCGGFSTFSTFSFETLHLFQMGNYLMAMVNILVSLLACLLSTFLGIMLVEKLF